MEELLDNTFRESAVLITGGLGFIGSALARRLVQAGANVTLIDSLIPENGGNLRNIGDYYASWDLIKTALGWQPELSLRAGLERTLGYYRERREFYWDE